ncbi:MAG: hypothetical protein KY440_11950 [Actinobacteria bacterium]|nr:hypothetical protein [Actinomycetota bacterium]
MATPKHVRVPTVVVWRHASKGNLDHQQGGPVPANLDQFVVPPPRAGATMDVLQTLLIGLAAGAIATVVLTVVEYAAWP